MVASSEGKRCCINLLDGQKLDITLQPKLLSSDLIDIVVSHFNLKEKEYFGLQYTDSKDNECWLRPEKKGLDHDFSKANPVILNFRVRHYVPSITVLRDNITVELFYLQARALIFKGDLECDSETVFLLAAHVLQATHGDYVSDAIALGDLKNLDVVPVRTLQEHPSLSFCEEKVLVNYNNLDGVTRGEAIVNYLNIVEQLSMYGVHYYDVKTKDKEQIPYKLGISHNGIAQYDFHDKTNPRKVFSWRQMENLLYRDKKFSVEYRENGRVSSNPQLLNVNSMGLHRLTTFRRSFNQRVRIFTWYGTNSAQCREMWLMAVSLHQFFLDKKPTHKNNLNKKSLREVARNLSKSTASLASLYSFGNGYSNYGSNNGYNNGGDNISDTASFYFSLDGAESVTSSQMVEAEQDMLSALTARKKFLEQLLTDKRELLNELCLREAELTGVIPNDLPESPTHPGKPMRRKVGTSFEFDESLLSVYHNMEGREFERLERDYEIQKQITSAAHRLALDPSMRKKVRKARQQSYQKSLVRLKTMEQQLEYLKRETAKQTREGLTQLSRKAEDEGDSLGDSLGPIDADTSSNKSRDSNNEINQSPTAKRIRRPRDSMYYARPVITSANIPINSINNLREKSIGSSSLANSLLSPRLTIDNELSENFDNDIDLSSYYLQRSYSVRSRSGYRPPPSPVIQRVKAQFHNSADQLNQRTLPRRTASFLNGQSENIGLYSIGIAKTVDFGSNPSLPHSISSPGIAQIVSTTSASPATLRRIQQLSLSPTQSYLLPPPSYSQSQSSLASSSEQSEAWSDIISEETLV